MNEELFIVAWTGGYELPQYATERTLEDAVKRAQDWDEGADEGDFIDILRVDVAKSTIERVPWKDGQR